MPTLAKTVMPNEYKLKVGFSAYYHVMAAARTISYIDSAMSPPQQPAVISVNYAGISGIKSKPRTRQRQASDFPL